MKLSTSKGSRGTKKRKWPVILLICLLPVAALAVFWFSNVRLPTGAWELPGGLISSGNAETLPQTGDDSSGGEASIVPRKKGIYTFLLCGTDADRTRTDTIMVVSLNINDKTLGMVSIPRDTYVASASRSVKKINGAYAGKNMDRLLDEVKTIVGFRPDYPVLVDFDGFIDLVDAIGGIEFDVPVAMKVNTYQSVTRNIPAGLQPLNGTDALGVVRHRKSYATQDLQRTNVQRDMLVAIAKKMLTPAGLLKLPQYKEIVTENLQTDLKWGEITALALEVSKIDLDTEFKSGIIPTKAKSGSGAYQEVIVKDALELINSTINPYDRPITADDLK